MLAALARVSHVSMPPRGVLLEGLKQATNFQLYTARFLRRKPHERRKLPVPSFEKRLDITILGTPNSGKSVLLNCLIKRILAATSRKRHTTRSTILGVFNHRNVQLAVHDTPGFVALDSARSNELKTIRTDTVSATQNCDVVLLVVDASTCRSNFYRNIFAEMVQIALGNARKEIILVLNKVDLIEPKLELLDITRDLVSLINGVKLGAEKAQDAMLDTTTFMISALHNDGVLDLKNYLISIADEKPWIIPKDQGYTSLEPEEQVREIILESLLHNVHDEIPYQANIECTKIEGRHLFVDITVRSKQHVRIIIGHKGHNLARIRQVAVDKLNKIFNDRMILTLNIQAESKEGVFEEELEETQ